MGEEEDKEKAEKLAAAKKRVAQLKKQKQKAAGGKGKKAPKEDIPEETSTPAEEGVDDADAKILEQSAGEDAKLSEDPKDMPADEPADVKEQEATASTPEDDAATMSNSRPGHGRQESLSVQSRLRSSSFRRTSNNAPGSPSIAMKSPTSELPPMTPDSSTITDIYRKQAARLEELEKEYKRLEKEVAEGDARWRKSEEELEELREANSETTALRDRAKKAEESQKEIEKLKAEISSLQRQNRSHAGITSRSHRSPSISSPDASTSPDSELKALVSSKDATITDMELEISNLRAQLSSQTSSCTTHGSQISALTTQLNTAEGKGRELTNELNDVKKSLNRLSEKAVKEGVEKTSSETKIRNLERELATAKESNDELTKKAATLEKKIETMNKLHRESEARLQNKLVAAEKEARDLVTLKKKLATLENENARLKDERERRRRKEATGTGDDEGLDELEDEERQKLERRIRELEGENFDLRRGVWQERRKELQDPEAENETNGQTQANPSSTSAADDFTEVPLSGTTPTAPRRLSSRSSAAPQKHSTLATALTSSLSAFRNAPTNTDLLAAGDDDLLLDDNDAFDETAFARAQHEEEMRLMVEHVRNVKRGLKGWNGWRLDLVEGRKGVGFGGGGGGGGGMAFSSSDGLGEIFEV